MNRIVIDASVAVKWVVQEEESDAACELYEKYALIAPDLIIPECANILWKKVARKNLTSKQADIAARLIQGADLRIFPTLPLMVEAYKLAVEMDHPAYDCIYIALSIQEKIPFVTADERLVRKIAQIKNLSLDTTILTLKNSNRI